MATPELETESEKFLAKGTSGDHLVLWYRTDRGRARAVAKFLSLGVKGGDLMVIVLPLHELQETEEFLVRERLPVERLMNEGRLLLFASEEFLPGKDCNCDNLRVAIEGLHVRAGSQGRRLRLVGRIAPVLFERGDLESALTVEHTADSSLGEARLLCLYDARKLSGFPGNDARKIDDVHSHSLDETMNGKVKLRRTTNLSAARRMRTARPFTSPA